MPTTPEAVRLPFKDAISYFRQKVNVPSAHWTAVMDQAHARSFAVAGATDKALIEDLRQAVDKAIAEGAGFKAFQGEFDSIVKKHGWVHTGHPQWRARVIYETNMSTAAAAGRYAQATKPHVLDAFPYWEWYHTPVAHPRPQHVAWNGLVLRADDPFWDTHYPPCGWGCRCIVYSRSEGDLRRKGKTGPDASPKIEWREYVNKTTGVVVKVPTGVDPGFVGNPGKIWLEGAKAPMVAPKVSPIGEEPPVLALPDEDAVSAWALDAFLANPEGSVQVGVAHGGMRGVAGGAKPVILPAGTVKSALRDAIAPERLRSVPAIVATPAEEVIGTDRSVTLHGKPGADGKRLVLTLQRHKTLDALMVILLRLLG